MLRNVVPAIINPSGLRGVEEPSSVVQKEILVLPMEVPEVDFNIFSLAMVESQPQHTQTGPMGSGEGAQAISLPTEVGSQSQHPQTGPMGSGEEV